MNISKLHITFKDKTLVDIAFDISSSLALVGQSGSGKSLTLKALLGMLPSSMACELEVEAGFEVKAGENISFVPQNPFTALSPLTRIRKQFFVDEKRIEELFAQVDLDMELADRFAPELSGGQLQRVVIAMALEQDPKLILLDEPTTALDPETRVLILDLLRELQKKHGFKMLFVTHDMYSAKLICDEICVIKDGKIVESGNMETILNAPQEEYTKTLIDANFANREFRK
ncbi:ABC transporter (possibly oligopeptides), ATP-binding protein [Sulfurimonas gotlandica GD1]|jgi:ABC-type glutathione transport system ATPase component|uniref:ABC transporter (Possibly oligopeptides), ATP-binding protein n=1 Tax=Sulfurimonas gotlandica (strain DSM 19862 / JCM 16533 / GD1) TaxID=929558 RepID=B6BHV3_SULGG|nr:ATP-binding cassette domain-containing protein [Sulfurimonas gotlandica]EDZ63832.1 ABC transporter ATP-binding protein [Sulfurimonas gotlandica GD1]EHP30104.1 ABC transporter (possibly oligopeptides), ATP-binding protein [Sulfurimonas gotlandica GD1]